MVKKLWLQMVISIFLIGFNGVVVFAQTSGETSPPQAKSDTGFFAGARLGLSVPIYEKGNVVNKTVAQIAKAMEESAPSVDDPKPTGATGFNIAAYAGYQITSMFGVQLGLMYNGDKAEGEYKAEDSTLKYNTEINSLMIPIIVTAGYNIDKFTIGGLVGIYFYAPLGDPVFKVDAGEMGKADFKGKLKMPVGLMLGANGAYKMGSGAIVLDIRYAIDFTATQFEAEKLTSSDGDLKFSETLDLYKKSAILFGIGYKYSF
jgi:hypothetical protein